MAFETALGWLIVSPMSEAVPTNPPSLGRHTAPRALLHEATKSITQASIGGEAGTSPASTGIFSTGLWHHRRVTVIKINAITVPPDSGDELARRFAARAGAVDDRDGFEGFELLKPIDDRTTWLVVTRWRDEAAFEAWVNSPAFAQGHLSASEREGEPPQKPVGIHSELWSYEIAGGSGH